MHVVAWAVTMAMYRRPFTKRHRKIVPAIFLLDSFFERTGSEWLRQVTGRV